MIKKNYLDVGIQTTGAYKVPIRMKVNRPYVGLMASEGAHYLGALEVPDLKGPALGPPTDQVLVPPEPHTLHRGCVPHQRLQKKKPFIYK